MSIEIQSLTSFRFLQTPGDKPESVSIKVLKYLESRAPSENIILGAIDPMNESQSVNTENTDDLLSNPPHIKQAVDSNLVVELCEMGFSEVRSEKSLFFTKNAGQAAIQWLANHEEDEDIDIPVSSGPRLSKEEAERKAVELQARMREARMKKEKEDEIEKERRRMEMTKEALNTQRLLEEAERKRMIEQIQKEKKLHEEEKQRQLELLKQEYEERFGKPYPEEERKQEEADISKKSGKDQVAYWIGRLKHRGSDNNKDSLVTCLKTMQIYCQNLYENPEDLKYFKIRKDNASFKTRIFPFAPEALSLLDCVGFKDNGKGYLAIPSGDVPDKFLLSQAIKFLGLVISQLS